MIILQTLKWSNCFSYGEHNELDLSAEGLVQIVGPNGAGKSSIPLILEEVLYNKNSKGVKKADIPNRKLTDNYSITLELQVDDVPYTIALTRQKTLKIKLEKEGKDISSHTATNTFKTISEIMKIDFKTFSQLVYQSTNSSLQFLTATDSVRKKFLIDLLDLQSYIEFFELFKKVSKELSTGLVKVTSKIETLQNWLDNNNLEGMEVLPMLNLEIDTEEDEKLLGVLLYDFENLSNTNRKIQKNNNFKKELSKINLSNYAVPEGAVKEPIDPLLDELGGINSDIKREKIEVNRVARLDDFCPTCDQAIPSEFKSKLLSKSKALIETLEARKVELDKELKEKREINTLIQQKKLAENNFESLFRSIDQSLPEECLVADDLEKKINKLKTSVYEKKQEITRIIKENNNRERNNTKISIIKEQEQDFKNQLQALNKELDEVLDTFNDLEILKKAFSTNGLPAYKIENMVKDLELMVNEYLSDLSDGRFTLEFVITNDKLNVQVTDNGKTVDIISLSSGELARVNTATLLAIRKLMNSISKSQINTLFLDEVINVLDDIGREKLVDVLVKEDKLNIFIVSHEWTHPLLSKLNIVKESDISRIENG